MSLRVLLADESDTIKKVFQLALQDFNAEVKAVHSGLDVIDVAKSFKPDILFADVLLQKKNGYQVCTELKQTNGLDSTPVVLMWSSFMELDQAEYKNSGANGQLEKPFDADQLRGLIQSHVPSAQEQEIGGFLEFPENIQPPNEKENKKLELSETNTQEESSEFNLDIPATNSSEIDFTMPEDSPTTDLPKVDEEWSAKDLSKFKIDDTNENDDDLEKFESLNLGETVINLPPPVAEENPKSDNPTPSFEFSEKESAQTEEDMSVASLDQIFADKNAAAETSNSINSAPDEADFLASLNDINSEKFDEQGANPNGNFQMDNISSDIEGIVRAHTEEVLKNHITKSLHKVMEKIIRDELSKILEEEIRLSQDINDGP